MKEESWHPDRRPVLVVVSPRHAAEMRAAGAVFDRPLSAEECARFGIEVPPDAETVTLVESQNVARPRKPNREERRTARAIARRRGKR